MINDRNRAVETLFVYEHWWNPAETPFVQDEGER